MFEVKWDLWIKCDQNLNTNWNDCGKWGIVVTLSTREMRLGGKNKINCDFRPICENFLWLSHWKSLKTKGNHEKEKRNILFKGL